MDRDGRASACENAHRKRACSQGPFSKYFSNPGKTCASDSPSPIKHTTTAAKLIQPEFLAKLIPVLNSQKPSLYPGPEAPRPSNPTTARVKSDKSANGKG